MLFLPVKTDMTACSPGPAGAGKQPENGAHQHTSDDQRIKEELSRELSKPGVTPALPATQLLIHKSPKVPFIV